MEIELYTKSEKRKNLLEMGAKFYAKKLNLNNSKFNLEIRSVTGLRKKQNCNGVVFQSGDKNITMHLDNTLCFGRLMFTLAHEMVHVKQIAKGQYKGKIAKNGKLQRCWMGKVVTAKYIDRPWEKEAFGREIELVKSFCQFVEKKAKKKG